MTNQPEDETGDAQDAAPLSPVRHAGLIGISGGVVAGVASSFIPMSAIEGFVGAYGIAELLPAAAPPLGNTARLALSTGIGTLTAAALFALLPRRETNDMGFQASITKDTADTATFDGAPNDDAAAQDGAARSGRGGLVGWLRTLRFGKTEAAEGEVTDFDDLSRKRVRFGDQHPDAPLRAPIFASSDLGEPLDEPQAMPETDTDTAPDLPDTSFAPPPPFDLAESLALPGSDPDFAPAAAQMRFSLPEEIVQDAALPVASEAPVFSVAPAIASSVAEPVDSEPLELAEPLAVASPAPADIAHLSIADLLDRLERGLERRAAQAAKPAPVAEPAPSESRFMRLAPVAVADDPVEIAEPVTEAEPAEDAGTSRFRFRIGQAEEDSHAAATGVAAPEDAMAWTDKNADQDNNWDSDVEYHPPVFNRDALFAQASGEQEPEAVISEEPVAPRKADDDMDAALQDALATLRQLSDRQRNI